MSFDSEGNRSPRDLIFTGILLLAFALGLYFLGSIYGAPDRVWGAMGGRALYFLFGIRGLIGILVFLGLMALILGLLKLRDD